MATLLRIDSSPLGIGASFSRRLTEDFVQHWTEAHPGGIVVTRDLTATDLHALNGEWIGAAYTPEASRNKQQREALVLSDELIAELFEADEYVIGVPMHNFSVPGLLKLWVDQVARAGKTFSYTSAGPEGLLKGKKATLILTSGGVYAPGTPMEAMNFAEPYLRSVLSFLGVVDVRVIRAGGTSRARDEAARAVILDGARAAIRGAGAAV